MAGRTLLMQRLLVAMTALATSQANQPALEVARLFDEQDTLNFGLSVSISGDFAIVGAPDLNTTSLSSQPGAAYIFVRSGDGWDKEAKLNPSNFSEGDSFGTSVSIEGDIAVVGASGFHANAEDFDSGLVFVFRRQETGVWSQEQILTGKDTDAGDKFGTAVDISEGEIIVGAENNAKVRGAAYIFGWNGSWQQLAKLVANNSDEGDRFGSAVSMSGDTVIVGAYTKGKSDFNNSGAAYIFQRTGSTWTQQWHWQPTDNISTKEEFGLSVSVSGDVAVVGAHWDDELAVNAGAAYIYTRTGSSWDNGQKLLAEGGSAADGFGRGVSISGNTILIGADFDNSDLGTHTGSAFIYAHLPDGWSFQEKLTWSTATSHNFFGRAVGAWDSGYGPITCIVGAPGANSSIMYEGGIPTTTTTTTITTSTTTSVTFSSTSSSSMTSTSMTLSTTTVTETSTSSSSSGTSTRTSTSSTSSTSITLTTATLTTTTATQTTATETTTTSTSATGTTSSKTSTSSTKTTDTTTSSTMSTATSSSTTSTASTRTSTSETATSATITATTMTETTRTQTNTTETSTSATTVTKTITTATTSYTTATTATSTTVTSTTGTDLASKFRDLLNKLPRELQDEVSDLAEKILSGQTDNIDEEQVKETLRDNGIDLESEVVIELLDMLNALKEEADESRLSGAPGKAVGPASALLFAMTLMAETLQ